MTLKSRFVRPSRCCNLSMRCLRALPLTDWASAACLRTALSPRRRRWRSRVMAACTAPREKTATNPWDAPVDTPAADHPVRKLSHKIASTVARWLNEKRPLDSRGRPILPGDIMVLVQSRGAIFDGVIRALTQHGVPVAGADRLNLMEDAAIEDLLSYAKFSVSSKDDLSLAEILKSPFFGWDDDELFELAYTRGEHESLWAALNRRCNEQPIYSTARDEIDAARQTGLRKGPYSFFSHILETGAPSGRKKLYERLGSGARDGVDELLRQTLAYENGNPRSLRAFINWFEQNAGEIKREMDRAGDAVRVMTVHGAKGLEAPIVFLADAHSPPNTKRLGPLFEIGPSGQSKEKMTLLIGAVAEDTELTAEARAEKKRKAYEEYRRLLYVAATRAEDELYICGVQTGNAKQPSEKPVEEKSWHALAEDAFTRLGGTTEETPPLWENSPEPLRRHATEQTAPVKQDDTAPEEKPVSALSWLFSPAAKETAPLRLSPSHLADEEEANAIGPAPAPAMSPGETDKYFRGRILHRSAGTPP